MLKKARPRNRGMTSSQILVLVVMTIFLCALIAGFVGILLYTNQPMAIIAPVTGQPTEKTHPTPTLHPARLPSATHRSVQNPTQLPTSSPAIKPTPTKNPPTITPFFPVLPAVDINSNNYPEIHDPPNLIQNPEAYHNKRLSVTLYVVKIVNATIDNKKQWIVSLSTGKGSSPYFPVLVFGLRSNLPYRNDPGVGNMITVYGIGMGGIDRQTLRGLFGSYEILPSRLYTANTDWILAAILGEDYFIVRR